MRFFSKIGESLLAKEKSNGNSPTDRLDPNFEVFIFSSEHV